MTVYNYTAKYQLKTPNIGSSAPGPVRMSGYPVAELGGAYQISGAVDRLGQVGSYRVMLFDRASGRYIRETTSSALGAYAFTNLEYRASGYFAVAFDSNATPLNAAIADLITPELMP